MDEDEDEADRAGVRVEAGASADRDAAVMRAEGMKRRDRATAEWELRAREGEKA